MAPTLRRCLNSQIPLVAIADRAPGVVSVVVDNEMGAFMLAEHLALRGHKRIMYRRDPNGHESAESRYIAFDKAARYHDMDVIPTLPSDSIGTISQQEEALLLAAKDERPTAVATWGDSYAFPVLKFCRLHHLAVPQDVAVSGFDGIVSPVEPAVRLTTVQAPWQRVAEKAADLMVYMLQGEEVAKEMVLPVDLVMGDTT